MIPFFKDYLDRLLELHVEIEQALEGLPQEALDWKPAADMNSLCVLVIHLTGAERYWIGDVVAGEPSHRERSAEFQAVGMDIPALKERLKQTEAYTRTVFESLQLHDLEAPRISPREGHRLSVAWSLGHALEHTALHLGHIQITSAFWKQNHL